jgi:DNA-binding IclR family transcriptional regulator
MSNESSYQIGSVDNALRILLLLSERKGLRVVEVAEELDVARSTAHRLLSALHRRNFVVQDAHKVYRPGPVFASIGLAVTAASDLITAVRPLLEEARQRTSETCHLAVLEGNGTRFLDCAESSNILRVGSRVGMLLPAHTNSAGKVLLAELSSASFAALYPRGVPGPIGNAKDRRTMLQRQLVGIRRRGYATNFDESEQGITAVGSPLRDAAGRAVAALAVACPSARCPRSRVTQLAEVVLDVASHSRPLL